MMFWTTGDDGFSNPPNRRRFWRAPRVVLVDPSRGRFEGGRPRGGRGRMRGAARRVVFRYDAIDAEGPRGWGVATRVARVQRENRTKRFLHHPIAFARVDSRPSARPVSRQTHHPSRRVTRVRASPVCFFASPPAKIFVHADVSPTPSMARPGPPSWMCPRVARGSRTQGFAVRLRDRVDDNHPASIGDAAASYTRRRRRRDAGGIARMMRECVHASTRSPEVGPRARAKESHE